MEINKQNVEITTDFIKLDQLLKFSGVADTGAIAKEMILDGIVEVNGAVCIERGRKIRRGDTVFADFEDEGYELTVI